MIEAMKAGRWWLLLGLVAVVAACSSDKDEPAPSAQTPAALAGALPQCLDLVDNDSDRKIDYPADPQCTGPTGTSEGAATGGCGALPCVTFITEFDPDGAGGTAPIVCSHSILVTLGTPLNLESLVTQPIDVNTAGCNGAADVGVAISVPLNGTTPNTKKPTIKIQKLATAPARLPLRIEAVRGDDADPSKPLTSIGYDAIGSTAPAAFTAALDRSERDGNAGTSDVKIDLTISGAGERLGIVSDTFQPGATLRERKDLTSNRLVFRGDGPGTKVPGTASIRLESSLDGKSVHLHMNHTDATALDFAVAKPNDNPKVTGTINPLPAAVDLDFGPRRCVAVRPNQTCPPQSRVTYKGSAPVANATVHFETIRETQKILRKRRFPKVKHRFTASATITDVPTQVVFDQTGGETSAFAYKGNGDLKALSIVATDERSLFSRAKWLEAHLGGVPKTFSASFEPGRVRMNADEHRLDFVKWRALAARPPKVKVPCGISIRNPCPDRDQDSDNVTYRDTPTEYSLVGQIKFLRSVDALLDPSVDVKVSTEPDQPRRCEVTPNCVPTTRPLTIDLRFPKGGQPPRAATSTLVGKISALQPNTRLVFSREAGTAVRYSDDGKDRRSAPDVTLDGTNLGGLPQGKAGRKATAIHMKLLNVPNFLRFTSAKGGWPIVLDASGATRPLLGKAEVQLTDGPNDTLPVPVDGVLHEDLKDKYVTYVRLTSVANVFVLKTPTGLRAELRGNQNQNPNLGLVVDVRKHEKTVGKSCRLKLEGADGLVTQNAVLSRLPTRIFLVATTGSDNCDTKQFNEGFTKLEYEASSNAEGLVYGTGDTVFDQPDNSSSSLIKIDPLPQKLHICRSNSGARCTSDILGDHEADAGSLRLIGSSRFTLDYLARGQRNTTTRAVLRTKNFSLQSDAQNKCDGCNDDQKGDVRIDTGWDAPISREFKEIRPPGAIITRHEHPAPPADQTVDGFIQVKDPKPPSEVRLTFGQGFAAQARVLHWPTNKRFYFGCDPTGIYGCITKKNHVYCAKGTSFFILAGKTGGFWSFEWVFEWGEKEFYFTPGFCGTYPYKIETRSGRVVPGIDD